MQLQAPAALATVVQTGVEPPSTNTLTRAPLSLVPAYTGVLLVVAFAAGAVTTGAMGAVVSTTKGVALEEALVPVAVVAVATTAWGPSPSALTTSQLQVPETPAVTVHAAAAAPST